MKTVEDIVMARVRRIYYMRKFVSPTALTAYVLLVCTGMLLSFVSVLNVFANMPSLTAPGALMHFLIRTVTHTELVVQILCVGMLAALGMLVRALLRSGGRQKVAPLAHA